MDQDVVEAIRNWMVVEMKEWHGPTMPCRPLAIYTAHLSDWMAMLAARAPEAVAACEAIGRRLPYGTPWNKRIEALDKQTEIQLMQAGAARFLRS